MRQNSTAVEKLREPGPGLPLPAEGSAVVVRYVTRRGLNIAALALGDMLSLTLAMVAAGALRSWLKGVPMLPEWTWILLGVWLIGSFAVGLLPGWGLGAVEELRRSVLLMLGVFALSATAIFLGKASAQISRLTLTVAFAVGLPLVLFVRLCVKRALIRRGLWGLPTVVYGASETAQLAIRALRDEAGLGYVPIGIFEDDAEPGSRIEGVPVLGGTADRTDGAPAAVVAMPDAERHRLIEMLEGPLSRYRRVLIVPDLLEAPSLWVQPRDLGGILALEVTHNLLDPFARFVKRGFDLFATLVAAPLWMPLCGAIAAVVWLEDRRAPVFAQRRVGAGGETFRTLKFRTMVPDAETVLELTLRRDPELRDEWARDRKLRRDPRVTRVGRFLRAWSLDELPQLFNVLGGRMSLVGPRPLPPYHDDDLPPRVRRLRERVRPGITGLWQVSGRSESGTDGMSRWDTYYVRNWSPWLDVVILVRTVRAVLERRGAY